MVIITKKKGTDLSYHMQSAELIKGLVSSSNLNREYGTAYDSDVPGLDPPEEPFLEGSMRRSDKSDHQDQCIC